MAYGAATMNAQTTSLHLSLAPEREADARAVDALIERAFGPGRYTKISERLREGNVLRRDLSFAAIAAGEVVGAVRLWPILVGEARGLFLGPIAVEGAWRKHGIGGDLIQKAVEAGAAAGEAFVFLVGDQALFGPHGFEVVPRGTIRMPGPVNPTRVLWRALKPGGLDGVAGQAHVPGHG
jgi:predicted N-acetyltransferase YhbS